MNIYMQFSALSVLLGGLLGGLCASCASVDVIPRFGMLDVEGEMGVNDASTGFSGKSDLETAGVQEDESVLGGRVDLRAAGAHATFMVSDSSHGGSGTLQATASDGTTVIPAGTPVDSELDLVVGEVMVTWDLVPGETVELGIGLGASVFDFDASFTNRATGDTVGTDEVIPVPLVAARAGFVVGPFDVSALAGGMSLNVGDVDATVLDLDLMARLKFFAASRASGAVVLGYRFIDIDAEYDDGDTVVDADMEFSGPYLGLSVGF